ncbi:MAG: DUF1569 domain-containing protein [Saprospiraceae bacterium]|nr:DUF1569 domain-containing protein [Saprospiraceae bacterium]
MQELTLAHANAFFENELESLLKKLSPTTTPLWGSLTAQHMVEHLAWAIDGAMERWTTPVITPEDKLPAFRRFLTSNVSMRPHFPHPAMPTQGELPALHTANLEASIAEFWERWREFEAYCEANPNMATNHPVFGPLNPTDWRLIHFKHVVHHLSQFGVTTVEEQGLVMPPAK